MSHTDMDTSFIRNPAVAAIYIKRQDEKVLVSTRGYTQAREINPLFNVYSYAESNRLFLQNMLDGIANGRFSHQADTNYVIDGIYGVIEWKQANAPSLREDQLLFMVKKLQGKNIGDYIFCFDDSTKPQKIRQRIDELRKSLNELNKTLSFNERFRILTGKIKKTNRIYFSIWGVNLNYGRNTFQILKEFLNLVEMKYISKNTLMNKTESMKLTKIFQDFTIPLYENWVQATKENRNYLKSLLNGNESRYIQFLNQ